MESTKPSTSKKRSTQFSEKWLNDSDFKGWIGKKNDTTATCKICNSEIAIQYEGRRALVIHSSFVKHKKLETARKMSRAVENFFVSKASKEESLITRAEVAIVFHNVTHALSYNSLDCLAKNLGKLFPDSQIATKLTCGRTKAASISRNILGPVSQQKVVKDLQEVFYFSVSSDASNVGHLKTFPLVVQYFHEKHGICRKLLDFYDDHDETSAGIFQQIKKIMSATDVQLEKISAYSADNASVNYGKFNSVYQKLKDKVDHIFKANCNCHIINNCVKYAIKGLDIDLENIVIKIYNEFSSSALRTEKLKECFEFAQIESKDLLRHITTRWLSFMPAIDRLVYSWPAVKYYFLTKGLDNCHKLLWEFIARDCQADSDFMNDEEECRNEGVSECYLFFLQNILPEFHNAILQLENDSCTVIEINNIMCRLLNQLKNRLSDQFFGSKVRSILKNLTEERKTEFISQANKFLKRSISYLEERYDFSADCMFKQFSLLSLKSEELKLTWESLSTFPELLKLENAVDTDALYSEFSCLRAVFSKLPKDMPNDQIWAHFFRMDQNQDFINLKKIVLFVLSIPISNAFCERIFSIMNNLWTKERNRMSMDLVKAELQIRTNFNESCSEMLSFLNGPEGEKILKLATSNDKYKW